MKNLPAIAFRTALIFTASLTMFCSYASGSAPVEENAASTRPSAEDSFPLTSALQKLHVTGGISAGEFFATNPGSSTSGNETLLSNFLFELSGGDSSQIVSFTAGIGETTTPSLLNPPETTQDIDLEYASVSLKLPNDLSVEMGLLKPDSGFEDSYTYKNANAVLGAVASQQPYNASGVKLKYSSDALNLNAAYYGKRLDETEYAVNDTPADHAWEAGIGTTIHDVSARLYHYHITGSRNLSGAVLEHTFGNLYCAMNVDRWQWDKAVADQHGRKSAMGVAMYATPTLGRFSLPVRLEYIDQGGSAIYLDNPETAKIYAATITPTYRFTKESYLRLEASYVQAKDGFTTKDSDIRDHRIYLATELGYLF